jgi:hypothetical protein
VSARASEHPRDVERLLGRATTPPAPPMAPGLRTVARRPPDAIPARALMVRLALVAGGLGVLLVAGPRSDLVQMLSLPWTWVLALTGVASVMLGAYVVTRLQLASPRLRLALRGMIGLGVGLTAAELLAVRAPVVVRTDGGSLLREGLVGLQCFGLGLITAIPWLLLVILVGRPGGGLRRGLGAGLCAAAAGILGLQYHCPVGGLLHHLVGHTTVVLVFMGLGMAWGIRLDRAEERRLGLR